MNSLYEANSKGVIDRRTSRSTGRRSGFIPHVIFRDLDCDEVVVPGGAFDALLENSG